MKNRIVSDKLISFFNAHLINYNTPFNLNYIWSLGAMSGLCLVLQVVSGIMLAMHYVADAELAFNCVEYIMSDVKYGWLIRYVHANGASVFFIVVYAHIIKALYYGGYCKPRQYIWFAGIIIFILMMATAFIGYVLPWGQMSLWGATVITSLFSAVPFIGNDLVQWLWGGYSVDEPTLMRFASLHYFLPYVILAVTGAHLVLLHTVGSSNPVGTPNPSTISFSPAFIIKDIAASLITFAFLAFLFTLWPNVLGHPDNAIPAQALVTPLHIVPEWYFLPYYAILRSIPHKVGGVVAMFGSLIILFILPFVNRSLIKSATFRPFYGFFLALWILNVAFLGWLGQLPVEQPFINYGLYATFYYFLFFLFFVPVAGVLEKKFAYFFTPKKF